MTDLEYSVRRSARARRVLVTVDARDGVEVVLPKRAAEREAAAAIAELRPWIEKRLREAAAVREALAARGASVPFLGRTLALVHQDGRTRAHRRGDTLLVPAGDHRPAVERWFRRTAREEIRARLDRAAAISGRPYTGLTIRGQRTRWASCSAEGRMSFNWRLLLAPEEVVDYVVWHEVCHLHVHDHSPKFWNLLEKRCPDYKLHAAWLRRHGATLVL
jgi:predicted metal-dependent hydrolase